ncbi:hypothetical protein C882_0226 [Caenispirillum salinarum AK4]|uniref:Thaumarchaeal output domain-containing protein n=1 Tax=Caenispirillum salinarum AK4 TaxID=1238182 RepID=K9HMN1_9PROT|nr:hypothetical protein [Caenispirillum salinarum]EKV29796.1 hypothetical protein C882_0226 [Caenispirillum salinarum AK4]
MRLFVRTAAEARVPSALRLHYDLVDEPERADVAICLGAPDAALAPERPTWAGLMPVVALETLWPLADHQLEAFDAGRLTEAVRAGLAAGARYREIPAAARAKAAEDPYLGLLAFIHMRDGASARLNDAAGPGVAWPFERLAPSRGDLGGGALIADLGAAGYVSRTVNDAGHPCPECGSLKALLRDVCATCGSPDIGEEMLVHHFTCGYQGPEQAFDAEGGLYRCPKCRRTLRHIGMDYDKPGGITVCRACDARAEETAVAGRCLSCAERFPIDRSPRRFLYDYAVTPKGLDALFSGVIEMQDPHAILSRFVPLVGLETLLSVGRKLRALGERRAFGSSVLTIDVGVESDPAARGDLARRVGEELAALLRTEDTVAYHMSRLTVLLAGAGPEHGPDAADRLRQALGGVFSDTVVDAMDIQCRPLDDVLDGDRPDNAGEGPEGEA